MPDQSQNGGVRGDRSIRNIPVPANHRRIPPPEPKDVEHDHSEPRPPRQARRRGSRWFLWAALAVILICGGGAVLLSTTFAGASVHVSPQQVTVSVPSTMSAMLNAPAGTLPYEVISTSRSASTTAKANGTTQVSIAASGVITISNDYSTSPQQLVATTRFEAPDGKIYRIHQAVTVPGATKNANGTLKGGTVSVTVYADQPGDSYNRAATTFTIPGFEGDPRYSKFSATTDAITGGFVGTQANVSASDLAAADATLKSALDSSINQAINTQVPAQYIALPGTLQISYGDVAQSQNSDGTATLSQTATASADVLQAADLAAAIAAQKVQGYNGEAIGFADPKAIIISVATSSTAGLLNLSLSGSPTLVWQFDASALKAALVGKPKSSFEQIVSTFTPAIECTPTTPCSASIRPFWSSTFPSNPDKITVVTNTSK